MRYYEFGWVLTCGFLACMEKSKGASLAQERGPRNR